MSLVINHNLMALNASRNLADNYNRLSTSVQRLSSGLRINSAADDAAGLAIRELMRADIATYGIMRTPGLVVDDEVVLSGRVPTAGQVKDLLAAR